MADERVNRKDGESQVCKRKSVWEGEGERKFMNLLSLRWLWPILPDSSGAARHDERKERNVGTLHSRNRRVTLI